MGNQLAQRFGVVIERNLFTQNKKRLKIIRFLESVCQNQK